jgi:hypothetical protein
MTYAEQILTSVWDKFLVLDLECQNHTLYERVASQFDPRNYVVAPAWSYNGGAVHHRYFHSKEESLASDWLPDLSGVKVMVGHNLTYDLLWFWKHPRLIAWLKGGGEIYDTQIGEYLLEGMIGSSHMNAMGDVAKRYPGGGSKLDEVKEMWQAGVKTADIPEHMLLEYLVGSKAYGTEGDEVGDINNTLAMFIGQLNRMDKMHHNFFTMLRSRMDGRLATTEMEYNGVYCDKVIGSAIRKEVAANVKEQLATLNSYIPANKPEELAFNWGSPNMKSAMIFGGAIGYKKSTHKKDPVTGEFLYFKKQRW